MGTCDSFGLVLLVYMCYFKAKILHLPIQLLIIFLQLRPTPIEQEWFFSLNEKKS